MILTAIKQVAYGASFIPGDGGWRLPVWCQLVTSGIVVAFVFFLPESVSSQLHLKVNASTNLKLNSPDGL